MRTYYHGYWIEVNCSKIGALGWRADVDAGTKEGFAEIRLIGQPDYASEVAAQCAALERVQEAIHDDIRLTELYRTSRRSPPVVLYAHSAAYAQAA